MRSASLAIALTLIGLLGATASRAQVNSPAVGPPTFKVAIVGVDIVVEGSGNLRIVELPEDGLLWGPGGDMNWPQPNPGAPSTPRAVMLGAAVEPGPGCQAVPSFRGVEGFSAMCPLQAGGGVQVTMSAGNDRLRVDGGTHERYYSDVFHWLQAPLEVTAGEGDDRIDTQTLDQVRVDGGPGDDRISLALSGPRSTLRGGPGDDSFAYEVFVASEVYEYDLTPDPRTRRVDLDCGAGADFVAPHERFRHGPGCPAQPPRLEGRPLSVRATCRKRCRWRGPMRLVAIVGNPSSRAVTLRSVRLAIERWDSEPYDRRYLTLNRRKRLRLRAHGSARIAIPAKRRRALNRQLEEYFLSFGFAPSLTLSANLVERDGDRTKTGAYFRVREGQITGVDWLTD